MIFTPTRPFGRVAIQRTLLQGGNWHAQRDFCVP